MKLFATLAALVSAEWNGVSEDNSCGMQIVTGANTFTGFDGASGDVDMVVFFEQDCSSGECDNSTCWDAVVNCVDNGAASAGIFFMETVNDHRGAKGGNVNLQLAGVSAGDTLQIDL